MYPEMLVLLLFCLMRVLVFSVVQGCFVGGYGFGADVKKITALKWRKNMPRGTKTRWPPTCPLYWLQEQGGLTLFTFCRTKTANRRYSPRNASLLLLFLSLTRCSFYYQYNILSKSHVENKFLTQKLTFCVNLP